MVVFCSDVTSHKYSTYLSQLEYIAYLTIPESSDSSNRGCQSFFKLNNSIYKTNLQIICKHLFHSRDQRRTLTELESTIILWYRSVNSFWIILKFTLNCTQIENYDDVMSYPHPLVITFKYNIKISVKGSLDNIVKFYFWLNFIYHVKCNC